jgi:uncharacterized protein YprB with RNaseH-like and TPR domain
VLTQTFCHIPGIGRDTERRLWSEGCHDWDCLLQNSRDFSYGNASYDTVIRMVNESQEALANKNHQYFASKLGRSEAWRAWPHFQDACAYLDIETDGSNHGEAVTMVGIYDGSKFRCLIKNADLEDFRDYVTHFSMIVTFFGSVFDLPMLCKRFKGLEFDHIHLDLCFTLKDLGYKGGLKKIEKQLGINRVAEVEGLGGMDAIRLWRAHQAGSPSALKTLIEYNREDVENLPKLAQVAYDGMSRAAKLAQDRPTVRK